MVIALPASDPATLSTIQTAFARLETEIDDAVGLIRGARDIEWVSDAADLYLLRLDSLTRMTLAVGSRITLARDAIRALERAG